MDFLQENSQIMEDHYGDKHMDVRKFWWLLLPVLAIGLGCNKTAFETVDWTPTVSVSLGVATLANSNSPDTTPDESPEPHPDADKCVCKGTGVITHGDGHTTPCPYHSKRTERSSCKCDTENTYCNCEKTYGICRCNSSMTEESCRVQAGPVRGFFRNIFRRR